MKKLISLALAIAMIISLSTTAFADTAVIAPDVNSATVTGSYVAGWESNGIVYSVDIEWEGLNFTYHAEKGAKWDPETLEYSETVGAYWEGTGTIKVTNRSNTKILAVPAYEAKEGYEEATMTFNPDKLKVASASNGVGVKGEAQVGTITVTPGGFIPEIDAETTIGTITLTISQDTDVNLREAQTLKDLAFALDAERSQGGYNMDSNDKHEFDMMIAIANSLDPIISDFENGYYDQDDLNTTYETLLEQYNLCLKLIKKYR